MGFIDAIVALLMIPMRILSRAVLALSGFISLYLLLFKIIFHAEDIPTYGIVVSSITFISSFAMGFQTQREEEGIETNPITFLVMFLLVAVFGTLTFFFFKSYFLGK